MPHIFKMAAVQSRGRFRPLSVFTLLPVLLADRARFPSLG